LLLQSFGEKKRFSGGVLANAARFLRFFLLRSFAIFSSDGITDFGIALAKHCKLAFCCCNLSGGVALNVQFTTNV